jgi:Zn-dependent protease
MGRNACARSRSPGARLVANQDPTFIVIAIIVLIIAITIHEFAHAKFADLAGDPTPRYYGRVTLNPLKHLDPMGTILMVMTVMSGFGIGWGRPVLVDPRKMRNPRWDHFISVAAGPLSNLLQAAVYAVGFRFLDSTGQLTMTSSGMPAPMVMFVLLGVLVNISLFLFNLLPIGPLDGHWLVGAFLPDRIRDRWYLWSRTTGSIILLVLVLGGQFARGTPLEFLDIIGTVLRPASEFMERILLGR